MCFWTISFALIGTFLVFTSNSLKVEPWQGKHWQGDIVLSPQQKSMIFGAAQTSNTGLLDLSTRWPKVGNYVWVPFAFDAAGNFSKADKRLIWDDLRTIEKKTCIRFLPKTFQTNYIHIFNDTGCNSYLGMVGGAQQMSIQNPGCVFGGTIAHEFIHALGYAHTMNRFDRDNYVTINFDNIEEAFKFAFFKVNPELFGDFNTSYDYFSVMHYAKTAFGINASIDTIVPTNISYLDIIGQPKVSPGDFAMLNNMYKC